VCDRKHGPFTAVMFIKNGADRHPEKNPSPPIHAGKVQFFGGGGCFPAVTEAHIQPTVVTSLHFSSTPVLA